MLGDADVSNICLNCKQLLGFIILKKDVLTNHIELDLRGCDSVKGNELMGLHKVNPSIMIVLSPSGVVIRYSGSFT